MENGKEYEFLFFAKTFLELSSPSAYNIIYTFGVSHTHMVRQNFLSPPFFCLSVSLGGPTCCSSFDSGIEISSFLDVLLDCHVRPLINKS